MNQTTRCWCGNSDLGVFSPNYLKCQACGTLVAADIPELDLAQVGGDEKYFYGRNYWFSYQEEDLGLPNIHIRSQTDLTERCLHWLRIVLKYKLPPGKILELGCAHGGFVALLYWAGFDATGLELSPWVVEYARQAFGVPMLLGPVEDQHIDVDSLDGVILMDVLEHLPNPVETIRHCLDLLKKDGILIIQTPCLPEKKTYEDMVARGNLFLETLKDKGHIYLFSQNSISEFFSRLGCEHVRFETLEPAIFGDYNMCLVASRSNLAVHSPPEIEKILGAKPQGRLVQALLDLDDRFPELRKRYGESETDRAARMGQINELKDLLKESESDRAARMGQINELRDLLKESESRRLEQINELKDLLKESESDRAARMEQINELRDLLKESESDRAARLKVIEAQQDHITSLETRLQELEALERTFHVRLARRLGLIKTKPFEKSIP